MALDRGCDGEGVVMFGEESLMVRGG